MTLRVKYVYFRNEKQFTFEELLNAYLKYDDTVVAVQHISYLYKSPADIIAENPCGAQYLITERLS